MNTKNSLSTLDGGMVRRRLFFCIVVFFTFIGGQAIAQENGRPDIHLPAVQNGKGAIQAIGDKLPALAKHYGVSAQKLRKEFCRI